MTYEQEDMATIWEARPFNCKIREGATFHNLATTYLYLYQFLFNHASSVLLSYSCKAMSAPI